MGDHVLLQLLEKSKHISHDRCWEALSGHPSVSTGSPFTTRITAIPRECVLAPVLIAHLARPQQSSHFNSPNQRALENPRLVPTARPGEQQSHTGDGRACFTQLQGSPWALLSSLLHVTFLSAHLSPPPSPRLESGCKFYISPSNTQNYHRLLMCFMFCLFYETQSSF